MGALGPYEGRVSRRKSYGNWLISNVSTPRLLTRKKIWQLRSAIFQVFIATPILRMLLAATKYADHRVLAAEPWYELQKRHGRSESTSRTCFVVFVFSEIHGTVSFNSHKHWKQHSFSTCFSSPGPARCNTWCTRNKKYGSGFQKHFRVVACGSEHVTSSPSVLVLLPEPWICNIL